MTTTDMTGFRAYDHGTSIEVFYLDEKRETFSFDVTRDEFASLIATLEKAITGQAIIMDVMAKHVIVARRNGAVTLEVYNGADEPNFTASMTPDEARRTIAAFRAV
jgi:hypothetical protein